MQAHPLVGGHQDVVAPKGLHVAWHDEDVALRNSRTERLIRFQ
jgi:hypothetical protein